ncbi:MAG: ATP synthase subunit I [Candidatus Izimaplasma sp.]|nr:ATP synthase subunit I [Candidatus Izimaplasma bacterium]
MENKDAFTKVFPFVWIYTAIGGAALWLFKNQEWGISFILGSVTSLMTMSMLLKSSRRVLENDIAQAQRMAIRNYTFRFFFYALILVVSAMLDSLELLATAIGLFSFKVVLYASFIFEKRGDKL